MFDPMIVTKLFMELSSPWRKIAENHVLEVKKATRLSLNHGVTHVANFTTVKVDFGRRLWAHLNFLLKALHEIPLGC